MQKVFKRFFGAKIIGFDKVALLYCNVYIALLCLHCLCSYDTL